MPVRSCSAAVPKGQSTEGDPEGAEHLVQVPKPGQRQLRPWERAVLPCLGSDSVPGDKAVLLPRLLLHKPLLTAGEESRQLKLHLWR